MTLLNLGVLIKISLFLKLSEGSLHQLIKNSISSHKSIINCAFNALDTYTAKGEPLQFALSSSSTKESLERDYYDEFLTKIHERADWTVIVKNVANDFQFSATFKKKTRAYLVHVRSSDDAMNIIKYLKLSHWNPKARFIIILSDLYQNSETVIEDIAAAFWKFHVLNGIILTPKFEDNLLIDAYSWFPYYNGSCGKDKLKTILINSCRNGIYIEDMNLYPRKVPLNMNQCPVIVRTVLWPPFVIPPKNLDRTQRGINFTTGIEVILMNTLAAAANFKVIYTISTIIQDWGILMDNGTATGGLFKQLLTESSDIGMASLAPSTNRYQYLDFTYSYLTESITWCVPIAQEEPKWISIVNILQLPTWLATIFSFLIIGFIIWRLSLRSNDESKIFKKLSSCYIYSFSTTLCLSLKTAPQNFYVRIVFIMWAIYSFALCCAFQTSLISKLTHPDYETQINSLDEIFESKLGFGYLNGLEIYFEDKIGSAKRIIEQGIQCNNAEECIQRVASKRDFAVALPRSYIQYISSTYSDRSKRLKIHWFKDNTVSYPVQMFSYKGFPLMNRIDNLILRLKAGGFVKKWLADITLIHKKSHKDDDNNDDDTNNEKVLKYENMEGPFLLLLFGLGFAAFVFICEIVYFKVKQILKNKKKL